jgi:3-phosphoshikimate 1-carboxyvinyltransferase
MSRFTVVGGRPLRGRIRVPGDKSISHRALILAALAEGTSTVRGLSSGGDVQHTALAVEAMGARVEGDRITGGELHEPRDVIYVGNSGTGIRLLTGLCAGLPWLSVLTGDASVNQRPMGRIVDPLRSMGARVDGRDEGRHAPLVVRGGGLHGIDYTLPVDSAQTKAAVLLAGLHAEGETVVRERVPVRAHTEEMLADAGADIEVDGLTVRLRPSELRPFELDVPGDPSQAAYWVVAATIIPGSDLVVEDVYVGRARATFLDVLSRMGADIELTEVRPNVADLRVRSADLVATDVGGAEVPGLVDEIPVLAVAAAVAKGVTTFADAAELIVKESDRVATTTSELQAMGVGTEARADGLIVRGGSRFHGGTVRSHGDHRIAMAMAVAGLAAEGETIIDGWDAVATSYPGFDEDLERCTS